MKFISVIGTRPNFVKEFLIYREFKKQGIVEKILHTGQHYDYEMSQAFFNDFNLPQPDFYLDVNNENSISFTGEAISRIGIILSEERPDFVLSYGDVNSTLAAAVASAKHAIPFAHIEGGIRTPDLYNPEEINRRVADVLAKVIYCCTHTDVNNLKKEGVEHDRIVLSGDLMKDVLLYTIKKHKIKIIKGDYLILTLHRQENIKNRSRLEAIVDGLIRSKKRFIFPIHPGSKVYFEKFGLMKKIANSRIEIIKPLGYLDFIKLAASSNKILTDSGGVRREAYILKKPCIVLIELSWFPEITQTGWNVLINPNSKKIAKLINEFDPNKEHPEIFGDGNAYKRIIKDLEERFDKAK